MQQWEYLRLHYFEGVVIALNEQRVGQLMAIFSSNMSAKGPSIDEVVADLGKDGWEMVSASYVPVPDQKLRTYTGEIWFKRPKS